MEGNATLRWVRALVLAAVMLGSGIAGHTTAGASAPSPLLLVPLFAAATVAVAPLLGTPASPRRVVALLAVGQVLIHLLLQWLGGTASLVVAGHTTAVPGQGSSLGAAHSLAHASGPEPVGSALTGDHLGMVLAHVAAALVVGLWLAAGERAAWTLLALAALPVVDAWVTLRELARADAGAALVPAEAARPAVWDAHCLLRSSTYAGRGVSRRGPPRLSAAAYRA